MNVPDEEQEKRSLAQTAGTCVHQTRPYILNENCVLVAVHIQKELYTVILYALLFAPWLFLKAFWKQQFISSPSRSSGGWDVITAGVI